MRRQISLIEDPTVEEGYEGMYLGTKEINVDDETRPFPFDLHAAAKYVRDNNLPGISEDVMKKFAY